jgi:hypothetical protein
MPFTVVFNDDGTIIDCFNGAHNDPNLQRLPNRGIGHLSTALQNHTPTTSASVTIIVIPLSTGGDDPCVMQGGQLWCP